MRFNNILILLFPLLIAGCKEMERAPLIKNDNVPQAVTNIIVENISGGAKISYSLPNDPDLLYIQASFSTINGQERIVKSSGFKNHLILEGFADTKEYLIKLYTVNRSENKSSPVEVIVQPLTPPIDEIFQTLKVFEDFGGVNTSFTNNLEKEYVFHTLYKNREGEWINYDRLYTKSKERHHSIRGLPAEETEFAFYFTDRWKNLSDTLQLTLTPLYEEELNKKLWKHLPLDNDTYMPNYGALPITKIWDGGFSATEYFIGIQPPEKQLPHWFTIDLGQKAKFSRLRVHQFAGVGYEYLLGSPRTYEIWGSNDPAPDGSWDNWTLLLECESIKPSGSGTGLKTEEDKAYAQAGEDYSFPIDAEKYRYVRFKTLTTWTAAHNLLLAELTLYGQPEE